MTHACNAFFLLKEELRILQQEPEEQTSAMCMVRPPADSISKDLPRV